MAGGLARELSYHSELSERLYLSAVRYARRDRNGKAAECLEQAVEHEHRADQIRELMSRRGRAQLVGLRGGKTWGKDSDETVAMHATLWPSGDFTIHRPVSRLPKVAAPDNPGAADNAPAPLGLSPLTNCTATDNPRSNLINRARRGSRGITPYNRRLLRSGASVMERKYGRKQLGFWTATIPLTSLLELAGFASQAHRVVDIVFKRLNRLLLSAGLPNDWCWAWELQERGALHLHCLFVGRKPWQPWAITPQTLDRIWAEAVSLTLNKPVNSYNWSSACRLESPRGRVDRELAKYLSKGSRAEIGRLSELIASDPTAQGLDATDFLPSAWVGMSDSLRSAVLSAVQTGSVEIAKSDLDWIELENRIRSSGRVVRRPQAAGGGYCTRLFKTEQGYPVAVSGRLLRPELGVLLEALSCLGSPQGVSVPKIA